MYKSNKKKKPHPVQFPIITLCSESHFKLCTIPSEMVSLREPPCTQSDILTALNTTAEVLCIRNAPITPQLLHHVFHLLAALNGCHLGVALGSKLGCIHLSKLLEGESPAMEAGAKANGAEDWINLESETTVYQQLC